MQKNLKSSKRIWQTSEESQGSLVNALTVRFGVIVVILSALFLMTGCSYSTKLLQAEEPANLRQPCDELEPLQEGANMGDLLKFSTMMAQQYNECRARHGEMSAAP